MFFYADRFTFWNKRRQVILLSCRPLSAPEGNTLSPFKDDDKLLAIFHLLSLHEPILVSNVHAAMRVDIQKTWRNNNLAPV